MRILRHRPTHHFLALLVRCRCGLRFLHRLDRPVVACLSCGSVDDLGRMIGVPREARQGRGRRAPRAARRGCVRAA